MCFVGTTSAASDVILTVGTLRACVLLSLSPLPSQENVIFISLVCLFYYKLRRGYTEIRWKYNKNGQWNRDDFTTTKTQTIRDL